MGLSFLMLVLKEDRYRMGRQEQQNPQASWVSDYGSGTAGYPLGPDGLLPPQQQGFLLSCHFGDPTPVSTSAALLLPINQLALCGQYLVFMS